MTRPLIPDEEAIHTLRNRFGVYTVRPGVTGLAQINGRDAASLVDRVRWDVKYVETIGFWNDVKILFATILKVLDYIGAVEGGCEPDAEKKIKVHSGLLVWWAAVSSLKAGDCSGYNIEQGAQLCDDCDGRK